MSFFLFADLRRDQQVVHCLKSLRKKNTIFVVYCPLFFFFQSYNIFQRKVDEQLMGLG